MMSSSADDDRSNEHGGPAFPATSFRSNADWPMLASDRTCPTINEPIAPFRRRFRPRRLHIPAKTTVAVSVGNESKGNCSTPAASRDMVSGVAFAYAVGTAVGWVGGGRGRLPAVRRPAGARATRQSRRGCGQCPGNRSESGWPRRNGYSALTRRSQATRAYRQPFPRRGTGRQHPPDQGHIYGRVVARGQAGRSGCAADRASADTGHATGRGDGSRRGICAQRHRLLFGVHPGADPGGGPVDRPAGRRAGGRLPSGGLVPQHAYPPDRRSYAADDARPTAQEIGAATDPVAIARHSGPDSGRRGPAGRESGRPDHRPDRQAQAVAGRPADRQ